MSFPYYDKEGNRILIDLDDPDDYWQFTELWSHEYRRVAQTYVGNVHISTVFLPIDHGFFDDEPVIFETMVFGYDTRSWLRRWLDKLFRQNNEEEYQWRYTRQEYAEAGHKIIVLAVQERRLHQEIMPYLDGA